MLKLIKRAITASFQSGTILKSEILNTENMEPTKTASPRYDYEAILKMPFAVFYASFNIKTK